MPNIQDQPFTEEIKRIVAIVMSEPGIGKTRLAGTFPRPNFMDFDQKIGVLRNPEFIKNFGVRSVQYEWFHEKSLSDATKVPNAFDDACRYFDLWMSPKNVGSFDTWVIDSTTSLTELCRRKAIYILGARAKPLSGSLQTFAAHGAAVYEQNDWGMERQLLEKFVRMIVQSGKHVLINVHEKVHSVNDVPVSIKPLLTGQSADIIPSIVPDVWVLKKEMIDNKIQRVLYGQPTGIYTTRSELGLDRIVDPTYDKIVARLKELQREAVRLSQQKSSAGVQQPTLTVAK